MILSARILNNVTSVNAFDYATQAEMTQGDSPTIYFQLIDTTADRNIDGFRPGGRRFVPAAGALLTATVQNIDNSVAITRVCTQPFPLDGSIWALTLMPTDKVVGTSNLKLALNQGGVLTYGSLPGALRAYNYGNI